MQKKNISTANHTKDNSNAQQVHYETKGAQQAYDDIMSLDFHKDFYSIVEKKDANGNTTVKIEVKKDCTKALVSGHEEAYNRFIEWIDSYTQYHKSLRNLSEDDREAIRFNVLEAFLLKKPIIRFRYGVNSVGPGRLVSFVDTIVGNKKGDYFENRKDRIYPTTNDLKTLSETEKAERLLKNRQGKTSLKVQHVEFTDTMEAKEAKEATPEEWVEAQQNSQEWLTAICKTNNGPAWANVAYLVSLMNNNGTGENNRNLRDDYNYYWCQGKTWRQVIHFIKYALAKEMSIASIDADRILKPLTDRVNTYDTLPVCAESTINTTFSRFKKAAEENVKRLSLESGIIILT